MPLTGYGSESSPQPDAGRLTDRGGYFERPLFSRTERGGFGATLGLCLGSQEPLSPASFTMAGLVPDLQHIIFWMSNSVELLYFIQQKCPLYMQSLEEDLDVTGMAVLLLPGGERPRAVSGERWPPEQRWVSGASPKREATCRSGCKLVPLVRDASALSVPVISRSPTGGGPGDAGHSLHSVSPWPPAPPERTAVSERRRVARESYETV